MTIPNAEAPQNAEVNIAYEITHGRRRDGEVSLCAPAMGGIGSLHIERSPIRRFGRSHRKAFVAAARQLIQYGFDELGLRVIDFRSDDTDDALDIARQAGASRSVQVFQNANMPPAYELWSVRHGE